MNAITKLVAVAVGALGIAGGAALAQNSSTTTDTPNDSLNRTGVSAPANVPSDTATTDSTSTTTDSSLTPRTDRN